MLPAIRNNKMMHEAIRLTADGELGNSDAIRLLQIPHPRRTSKTCSPGSRSN